VAEARSGGKSLPQLVEELWELIRTYVKQETVEPLKGLGRYIGYGIPAALAMGFGLVLLFLAGLRAAQTESGDHFTGNLSWLPYAITAGGTIVIIGLTMFAITRARRRVKRKGQSR
jgi:hypothetical protein